MNKCVVVFIVGVVVVLVVIVFGNLVCSGVIFFINLSN